jgi:hypothetical protein
MKNRESQPEARPRRPDPSGRTEEAVVTKPRPSLDLPGRPKRGILCPCCRTAAALDVWYDCPCFQEGGNAKACNVCCLPPGERDATIAATMREWGWDKAPSPGMRDYLTPGWRPDATPAPTSAPARTFRRPFTLGDLKARLERLTEAELCAPAVWASDEAFGAVTGVTKLRGHFTHHDGQWSSQGNLTADEVAMLPPRDVLSPGTFVLECVPDMPEDDDDEIPF